MTSNRAIHTSGTRQHREAAPAICNVADSRGVHRVAKVEAGRIKMNGG